VKNLIGASLCEPSSPVPSSSPVEWKELGPLPTPTVNMSNCPFAGHEHSLLHYKLFFSLLPILGWQFKLATWLRVYNYVKNKHVRAETVAYLVVV
jgi:hypothetical protein